VYNPRPMRAILKATVAAMLLIATSPFVAAALLPDGKELEAQHARIGSILISRKNIFDPSDPHEDHWPYRLANSLHMVTREEVIRRELLFHEGDLYEQKVIDESERNLRSLRVIYHVRIRPIAYHDGVVDLEVTSQDTWTLRPSVNLSRAGGNNAFSFSFSEQNLLGRLKILQIAQRSDVDRTTTQLQYLDPRILGSRFALRTYYADSSDGVSWGLFTARPFYSLDSRWSMNAGGEKVELVSKLYGEGDVISEFHRQTDTLTLTYGISSGLVGTNVVRFLFGYSYLSNQFERDSDQIGFGTTPVPENQKFSGPIFTLQTLKTQFIKVTNYNQFDREEDINLGNDLSASVWLSLKDFEAYTSQVILNLNDTVGIPISERTNFLYSGSLTGRVGSGDVENVVLAQAMETYCRVTPRQTFYGRLGLDVGINLDGQNQFLLGGDSGLRGYPTRQFDGDRRLLLTLEHRFFSDIEVLRLVRVGFAGFYDVGDAWYGTSEKLSDLHSDFGVGLRFGVVRSSVANISRLDLAYSVDAAQTDSPRFMILFGTAVKF
jgi:outer membrane protein assembly factor BamA